MRMLMQCIKTKRFVKINVDEIRAGVKDAPIWVMVDNEEDASNDPGWIGEDHTMAMLMFVKEHYGCDEGLTCYTPKAEVEAEEERRAKLEKSREESSKVIIVGGRSLGRTAAIATLAATVLTGHSVSISDIEREDRILNIPEDIPMAKVHLHNPKRTGYVPHRKQMRAMNKQFNQRSKGKGR